MNYIRGVQYKIRLPKFAIWKGRKNGLDIEVIKGILYIDFQIKACDMMNKRRFTMYTKQPKKMIIINILDILKRYTDENHRLSQREIRDILERE